jgi:hypothetical protein
MIDATRRVGFWSALAATLCSVVYIIAQLAEWQGWLGSAGGPESASTPLGLAILLTPSLLLGSAFLVLMISVHQIGAADSKVWSHAAVAFATVYAVLISLVYYVQLTLVAPRIAQGRTTGIEVLLFEPFDSLLYAVDMLGYSFMSVSTLFAARALPGDGLRRHARFWLTANGLLLPFLALQMYWPELIWPASLWALTFPAATLTLALLFQRSPSIAANAA